MFLISKIQKKIVFFLYIPKNKFLNIENKNCYHTKPESSTIKSCVYYYFFLEKSFLFCFVKKEKQKEFIVLSNKTDGELV